MTKNTKDNHSDASFNMPAQEWKKLQLAYDLDQQSYAMHPHYHQKPNIAAKANNSLTPQNDIRKTQEGEHTPPRAAPRANLPPKPPKAPQIEIVPPSDDESLDTFLNRMNSRPKRKIRSDDSSHTSDNTTLRAARRKLRRKRYDLKQFKANYLDDNSLKLGMSSDFSRS